MREVVWERCKSTFTLVGALGGIAGLWFGLGPASVVVLAGFVFMLFMHELGHYLTARASGMQVTQFFVGFGPRLWSFTRGETEYGIKALPLGAHVRITGMNNVDYVQPGFAERSFTAKSYPKRLSVMAAGSAMHFIMAVTALFVLHGAVGWYAEGEARPQLPDTEWVIGRVVAESPADKMGLQLGDQIIAVGSTSTATFNEVISLTAARPDGSLVATVLREGDEIIVRGDLGSTLDSAGAEIGFLGIGQTLVPPAAPDGLGRTMTSAASDFRSLASDSVGGVLNLPRYVGATVATVAKAIIGGEAPAPAETMTPGPPLAEPVEPDVVGIIGILRLADSVVSTYGWANLLFAFAAANVFIGVFNLIPLLPFDGGHIAIATYERLRSSRRQPMYRADVWKLLPLAYATIAFLGLLTAIVLWNDVTSDFAMGS